MKRKLISLLLAAVLAASFCSTAFAYEPIVPGQPVTMASEADAMTVIDEQGNLWVYQFVYMTSNTSTSGLGRQNPEILDKNVASVSVSSTHIAYIKTDGSLWLRGSNRYGGIGVGERLTTFNEPIKVMENVKAVSAGTDCTAAIRADGSLWLWGSLPGLNPFGNSFSGTQTPFKAADGVTAVALVPNTGTTQIDSSVGVFLKEDGSLWGWGSNYNHVLFSDFYGENETDMPVKLMDGVASFAVGDGQIAAVKENGDLYVWGNNGNGNLGFPKAADNMQGRYQLTPKKVMSDVSKVAISFGNIYSTIYAIKTDGTLWGAGQSQFGQLGDVGVDPVFTAGFFNAHTTEFIKVLDDVVDVAAVEYGVYAKKSDGTLLAWGSQRSTGSIHLAVNSFESFIPTPTKTTFPNKPANPATVKIGTVTEPAGNPFTDVAYGTYCYDAIQWALKNNITTGTSATTFTPQNICTRGHVVTFLWRAMGCPEPKTAANPFEDVKETDYFYKPVLWAVENGITKGTSETKFTPQGGCSEAEMVTFLWRAAGQPKQNVSALPLPAWQKTYFAEAQVWAKEKGFVSAYNAIDVAIMCTRGNTAKYLYKMFG